MIQVDRFISRLLTAAMVLAIVGAGQVVRAQDDEGEAEEAPAVQVRHVFIGTDKTEWAGEIKDWKAIPGLRDGPAAIPRGVGPRRRV